MFIFAFLIFLLLLAFELLALLEFVFVVLEELIGGVLVTFLELIPGA